MHTTTLRSRAVASLSTAIIVALLLAGTAVTPRVAASPGPALRIVDAAGNTPVVNEGGRIALRVVDGAGSPVSVSSWSSDNKAIGKVKRTNGLLRGKTFGFATVTAQTSRGPVSGFVVCARLRRQNGAMTQGDTKTDTGGNVYLSSPVRHVLYRATAVAADVFAGQTGVSGYQDGAGGGVRFNGPAGIGVDNRAEGGLYVADAANHCIRKIDFRSRSSLAAGTPGFEGTMFGDENPISEAMFANPRGVASVGANLYVTDTGNHCVWYVDVQRQRVQLVAGNPGESGNTNGEGREARFNSPSGITVNTRGNLLAVADTGNNVVRLIAIAPRGDGDGVIGQVTTLGLGSSARHARILEKLSSDRGTDEIRFDAPISVSFDGVDNVYVIDNQTASVVTRPSAASGRPVERVDLAQVGTLGDPASVTVRRTQAFVLDEAATSDASAVNVVEVGAPTITAVTPDSARLEGGQQVTITGTNFAPESKLTLGDAEVTGFEVISSTQIRLVVPPQEAPGGRTLTVLTRGGVAQRQFNVLAKPLAELADGEITTVYGGIPFIGDGGPALTARLLNPFAISVDPTGGIVTASADVYRIRRIDQSTGIISTIAGTGNFGYSGDGSLATAAEIGSIVSLCVDQAGNVYFSDEDFNCIRRIEAITGVIGTVAGSEEYESAGDGGPARLASLNGVRIIAVDSRGNLVFAEAGRIRRIDAATGIVDAYAGNGIFGSSGDDGDALDASIGAINGFAFDADDNLYFSEGLSSFDGNSRHRVRRIDADSHIISAFAGSGAIGYSGDGGPALSATLDFPSGLACRADGSLLIADSKNHVVRLVDIETGLISTVAGTGAFGTGPDGVEATDSALGLPIGVAAVGTSGFVIACDGDYLLRTVDEDTKVISTLAGRFSEPAGLGDNGTLEAAFVHPLDIAFDGLGNMILADSTHNKIRSVNASTGIITTLAGTGEPGADGDGGPALLARFRAPRSVAVAASGEVIVADAQNFKVRGIRDGVVRTIAGNGESAFAGDGGPADQASIRSVFGVAVDGQSNIYISDRTDNRVRRIDATSGVVTTWAGNGMGAYSGDGGIARLASLNRPVQVAAGANGNLYISDQGNHRIRRIVGANNTIGSIAGNPDSVALGDGGLAVDASLAFPNCVAVDAAGNVFLFDGNGPGRRKRVRRIDASTRRIQTVAGGDELNYSGDGGPAVLARLQFTGSMKFDSLGNLYLMGGFWIRVVKGIGVPAARRDVPGRSTAR